MFNKGEKVHLHDGTVVTVKRKGTVPRRRRQKGEVMGIRGFVRGALVDPDGTEHMGDWHENVITQEGHKNVIRCFAGLASSSQASWWAVGNHTEAQSSNFSTQSKLSSEYGTNQASAADTGTRALVTENSGTQTISSNFTLTQTHAYAASHISHNVVINAVGQALNSLVATTSNASGILSIATFASSSKASTQALNITYSWLFST